MGSGGCCAGSCGDRLEDIALIDTSEIVHWILTLQELNDDTHPYSCDRIWQSIETELSFDWVFIMLSKRGNLRIGLDATAGAYELIVELMNQSHKSDWSIEWNYLVYGALFVLKFAVCKECLHEGSQNPHAPNPFFFPWVSQNLQTEIQTENSPGARCQPSSI